ncbi:MAG: hypothetical protein SF066_18150 [Thermoanaerobaculia bacterium]|nr:hypothetical protein [Thermoanaerobaculia bacterium]
MTRRLPAFALAALLAFVATAPPASASEWHSSERPWWNFVLSWLTTGSGEVPSGLPGRLEAEAQKNSVTIDPDGRVTATSPAGDTTDAGATGDPLG